MLVLVVLAAQQVLRMFFVFFLISLFIYFLLKSTVIEINLNTYATTSTYNTAALSAVCFNTASFFDPVSRHAFMIDSYFFGDVWRFDTPGLVQQGFVIVVIILSLTLIIQVTLVFKVNLMALL